MNTWPAYVALQAELAYGGSTSADSPSSKKTLELARRIVEAANFAGPTLVVGPGCDSEPGFACSFLPAPLVFLTSHLPEVEALSRAKFAARVGDVHSPPPTRSFEDATYGLVFANNVLEHLVAPIAALLEIRRMLLLGGHAYFVVPSFEGDQGGVGPFHLHCGYGPTWKELMRKAGLAVVLETRQTGDRPTETAHYDHVVARAVPLERPYSDVLEKIREIRARRPA